MSSSLRLQGLRLLRSVGAPVPVWQVVRSLRDVERLELRAPEFGWTIRTCRQDGKPEAGLYYLNHASTETLLQILRDRLEPGHSEGFYIVYPSWQFQFSCNIVLAEHVYYIEGKYGSQKMLAVGKTTPDFGFRVPFGIRSEMECYVGNPSIQVESWLGDILFWVKRIPGAFFYAEAAVTESQALVFYELFREFTPRIQYPGPRSAPVSRF
jgi:hypothetical protein